MRSVLNILGGAAIVVASFWATLYTLDRATSTIEMNTDRQGGDFRSIAKPTISVEACANECERDPACQAWTLVKGGILAPEMMCLLKNKAFDPLKNACCTSGKVSRGLQSFVD